MHLLLTDLDGTIYNWVDYFAPCFRGMVHALSKETEISEEVLYDDFKSVFRNRGSLEYSFAVQELALCRDMSEEEIAELVRIAKGAFSRVRQKRLRPYQGVRETLKWARKEKINVVAVTNAPIFLAKARLRQLRIDSYFCGIAAWKEHDVPDNHAWTREIKRREEQGEYKSQIQREWPLNRQELKPSINGYRQIMDFYSADPSETFVVGDSLYKDVAPAIEIGAIGIWARYGLEYNPRNFETLLRITHWDQEKISAVYEDRTILPSFEINSFSELRRIIPERQPMLPGFKST